jgi:signal transduction histidine kinase
MMAAGASIRQTLLLAFLLVGVTPAVLLAYLGFNRASQAVQTEIEQGLVAQAEAVASDVNKLMYERLQNAATWSRLEVMQDLQVGDVDKRLSGFLQRLQRGYAGLYSRLQATDRQGRVVAGSDAEPIGSAAHSQPASQTVALAGDTLALEGPASAQAGGPVELTIRIPVNSAFGAGVLGDLRLTVDWGQIDHVLDEAADNGRMLALLDAQGRLLAGSKQVRAALPRLSRELTTGATPWALAPNLAVGGLPREPMIVGVGQARGFGGFAGFGWRVLVLVPRSQALAPITTMAWIFAALLGGIALATMVAAGWVSQVIARPITALTEFTRRYVRDKQITPPPQAGTGEVGELRDAFVQMVRDIDQSQQRLARASALAAVGEMSAAIAHEVRTPLGILRSSAQILRRESGISEEGRELVGFIESETQRLNGLVSAMLDSARPRAPHMEPNDLHALIAHAAAMLSAQAADRSVQITLQLSAPDAQLACDAEQMTQVLLNLMLNGLQILKQGGRMQISTAVQAEMLVIDVADDGPGIAPEERQRIFEAFFFKREGGLGLGLAVVQKIVAAHGGDIEASESELGGALFRIRLPKRTEDA